MKKAWQDHKVCIGLCNNQDKVDSSFFWNFVGLAKPTQHIVIRGQASIKSASLNTIVKEAWKWKCEKVLFLDIDMEFPFDTIPKLLERDLPIVSGMYYLKRPPYSPVAGWKDKKRKKFSYIGSTGKEWKEEYSPFPDNQDHLVEVDWCGIGCLMVDMDVFEKMKFPCFYDKWNWELGERQKGHDILFCEGAKKAGYKVYVDTLVQCDHVGSVHVNDLWVRSYYAADVDGVSYRIAKEDARESQYWEERHFADKVQRIRRVYPGEWKFICSQIPENSLVAEVGCGPGFLMTMLKKERKCSCYGFDLSQTAIKEVKRRGFDGEVADFRTHQVNGKMFDHVIASHVLEHMIDDVAFIEKLASLLKTKEGKVIVGVPTENIGLISELEHQRVYDASSLKQVMGKVFSDVIIKQTPRLKEGEGSPMLVAIGSEPHGN